MTRKRLNAIVTIVAPALVFAGRLEAQVGTVEFPTSASGEVQEHFIRGVAFLHSFAFDDAIDHFRQAQELDPDFALAYWGEAMAYNENPLVDPTGQNLSAARRALAKLAQTRAKRIAKARTDREKAYMEGVEILYGAGPKDERDAAYAEAMRRLVEQYPDDDEARAFYALALLGTVRRATEGYRIQMKAGAIAQELLRKNPDHPGAAHYIIHSFDDPVHAPLALYAAKVYSNMAPEAEHALHMPSHIFVQLGMWEKVAKSNQRAYDASVAWVERKRASVTKRDFHALAWLQYAHLQMGHYDKAKACIALIEPIATRENTTSQIKATYANMKTRYLLESERWNDIPISQDALSKNRYSGDAIELLALGTKAAKTDDLETAAQVENRLAVLQGQDASGLKSEVQGQVTLEDLKRTVGISHREVAAWIRLREGRPEEALGYVKEALAIEAEMHPSYGPPEPIKPPQELYGEILLELGRTQEAAAQFEEMQIRFPNRTQSILGAAQAAVKKGDAAKARRYYKHLLKIWDDTSQSPGLQEAKQYLASSE